MDGSQLPQDLGGAAVLAKPAAEDKSLVEQLARVAPALLPKPQPAQDEQSVGSGLVGS